MRCLCPTNTLKLFIRSVAHIDVVTSPRRHRPTRRFISIQTRSLSYETSSQSQHLSSQKPPAETQDINTRQCSRAPDIEANCNARAADTESAFAEFTSESIEAIAKEAKPQSAFRDEHEVESEKGFTDDIPDRPLRTTFRRTKVQNTSLAIHFSAPRAPPLVTNYQTSNSGFKPDSSITLRPNSRSVLKKEREKPIEGDGWTPPPREQWQIDKAALKAKFPEGWNPQKRLSPDALAGIRALHAQMPEQYTTSVLAQSFEVSPDAIRRILRSKWSPDSEEETDRQRRWLNRGKKIYGIHADKGQKPPKKWRQMGIGDGKPEWMLKKQARARTPLPALITTARRRMEQPELEAQSKSLADRIL
jgi:hypothetical protein